MDISKSKAIDIIAFFFNFISGMMTLFFSKIVDLQKPTQKPMWKIAPWRIKNCLTVLFSIFGS